MSSGAEVVKVIRFDRESVKALKQLTEEAIRMAIEMATADISQYAMFDTGAVPVDTGRLKASFDIAFTPRHIAMKWSAIKPTDPRQFDYADHVDKTHSTHSGYSKDIAFYAKEALRKALLNALAAM
jgi:hypothetical protein